MRDIRLCLYCDCILETIMRGRHIFCPFQVYMLIYANYYVPQAYLKVLPKLVHHPSVLTPDFLAPGAAVGRVVANVNARSRERGAFSAGTHGALRGALTLGAVIRVQEIPFSHVVYAAIGFAGALLLSSDREP